MAKGERGDCKLSRSRLKRTGAGLLWQPPQPCKPAGHVNGGLLSSEIRHIPGPGQGHRVPPQSGARASPWHSWGQRFRGVCWCQLLMATLQLPLGSCRSAEDGLRSTAGLDRVSWEESGLLLGSSLSKVRTPTLSRGFLHSVESLNSRLQSHLATAQATPPEAPLLESKRLPPHRSCVRAFTSSPRVFLLKQNPAVDKKAASAGLGGSLSCHLVLRVAEGNAALGGAGD